MEEYGLGWIPSPKDDRDWGPDRLVAMVEALLAVPMAWITPVQLGQGKTGHCVAFAGGGLLASNNINAGVNTTIDNAFCHELYYALKAREGILPGDPRLEEGTCLRTLGAELKARGLIEAYALTQDFPASDSWVQKYGPVIDGVWWYRGMFAKDARGRVRPTGEKVAGHGILRRAKDQTPGDNVWHNSWDDWGECTITDMDLAGLLSDGGESLLMVKKDEAPPKFPWPDLEQYSLSADDVLSIWAAYDDGEGVLGAYPDGTFRYEDSVSVHQLGAVMCRLGSRKKNPWEEPSDYVLVCSRGFAHEQVPSLRFEEERWFEPLLRGQLLLLVGRLLRGV